jgi:twinkle protein
MAWSRSATSSAHRELSSGSHGTRANGTGSPVRDAATPGGTREASGASQCLSRETAQSRGTVITADGTEEPSRTLSAQHVEALEARALDPEVAVKLGLYTVLGKFAGKDGLAIPMVREGQVINHKYRGPNKQFAQDKDAPRSFWNEDVLRDDSLADLPVMITEGEMDGLVGVQVAHGLVRTISVIDGASTNLDFMWSTEGLWPLFERVPRFILAGDGDEHGQKLNAELARRLGAARCAWLEYPVGKDLNDVLRVKGATAALACIEGAKPYPIKGLYRLSDFPDAKLETLDTGWPNLDPHLKLWVPELALITGIPSHGKSKFALHLLAQQVERHRARCAIFSGEMPIVPHVRDELRAFHGGSAAEADTWIEANFIFLASDPRAEEEEIDMRWIVERSSDAVIRYGVNWVLIDPWNQIEHRRNRESVEEYQERALRELNRFRRSFACGVIVVAHPTKDVKGRDGQLRTPGLYDVSGSAHWYNAPDHGIVVDRPNGAGTLVRIIIRKSRFAQSGHAGEAWLRYDPERGRYVAAGPTSPNAAVFVAQEGPRTAAKRAHHAVCRVAVKPLADTHLLPSSTTIAG